MLHEFLPGSKNRLLAILERMEENALRRKKGMPTVAEETAGAVARLKEKYPYDEWIQSAEDLVKHDRKLDADTERVDRMADHSSNN